MVTFRWRLLALRVHVSNTVRKFRKMTLPSSCQMYWYKFLCALAPANAELVTGSVYGLFMVQDAYNVIQRKHYLDQQLI